MEQNISFMTAACPPGYVQNERSCYRPIQHLIDMSDWESNQTCARSHWQDVAHHVTVTSLSEQTFAVGLAAALRYKQQMRGSLIIITTTTIIIIHGMVHIFLWFCRLYALQRTMFICFSFHSSKQTVKSTIHRVV